MSKTRRPRRNRL